ncbi:MAG: acyl-CoA dehydrogenase family protein, partial [Actinomycetota bacterium]
MNAVERATLAAEARRFLEAEFAPADTRALFDDPLGYREQAWRKMCELGWLGASVDLGSAALAALAYEAGRVLLPGPFLPTAALAVPLLSAANDPLLPRVLSGESIIAVADGDDPVPDAAASDHIVVLAPQDPIVIQTKTAAVEPLEWMDLARRVARVRTDGAPVVTTLHGAGVGRALDMARVAIAAESLGAAERAREIATAYAKER